jgi:hypothetical protein
MDTMRSAGKRGLVLAPVAALLLSVAALLLGNGLLSTLLIVRAGHKGFSTGAISAMMSFYFAGFTIGALVLPPIIVSVGHVRTFAGFAAIASMTALLHVAFVEPIAWMPLRLITGFAYAGMILATESWLNAHALPSTRGQLLSIFGVVSMGSWAIGQALLKIQFREECRFDPGHPHHGMFDPGHWPLLTRFGPSACQLRVRTISRSARELSVFSGGVRIAHRPYPGVQVGWHANAEAAARRGVRDQPFRSITS